MGFGLTIILARALGVQGFGQYALALAWSFGLLMLAEFGLATAMTRDLARAPQHTSRYLVSAAISVTAIAFVLMPALVIAAPYLTTDAVTANALRLATPIIWLGALYNLFTAIFRAAQRMFPILLLNVGGLCFQILGALALWIRGSGVLEFVGWMVITLGLQLGAAYIIYRARFRPPPSNENFALPPVKLARASLPFAFAAGLGVLQLRAPTLMLGMIAGESAVGLYSSANRWTEALKLVPGGYMGALFPAFAALAAHNRSILLPTYHRARRVMLAFGIACALGLTFVAGPLLTITFGPDFAPAAPVLVILAWAVALNLWNNVTSLYMYAFQREHAVNQIRSVGLGIQIATSVLLMWQWGATGGVAAVLLGESLMSGLYYIRARGLEHAHVETTKTHHSGF